MREETDQDVFDEEKVTYRAPYTISVRAVNQDVFDRIEEYTDYRRTRPPEYFDEWKKDLEAFFTG